MARYISTTDTAKLIRTALASAFPGQKFSVKSRSYSGGSSISVSWTDGPTHQEVEAITNQFEGASFDSSIDLKSYHDSVLNGEVVRFGANFVFCSRSVSAEAMSEMAKKFTDQYGWNVHFDPYYGAWRTENRDLQSEFNQMWVKHSFYVHPQAAAEAELMHEYRDF